jgi:hypothetical protein
MSATIEDTISMFILLHQTKLQTSCSNGASVAVFSFHFVCRIQFEVYRFSLIMWDVTRTRNFRLAFS